MAEPSLTRVTVKNATADHAIRLKYQLVQDGLIQGQDFSWTWDRPQDHNNWYPVERAAHFDFADAATATFYQLKWA
jgi:hypothetical protein